MAIAAEASLIFGAAQSPLTHVLAEVEARPMIGSSLWIGLSHDCLHYRVVCELEVTGGQCGLDESGSDEMCRLLEASASLPRTVCPTTRRIFGQNHFYVVRCPDYMLHYSLAPALLDESGLIRAWGLRVRSALERLCSDLRGLVPRGFVISEEPVERERGR